MLTYARLKRGDWGIRGPLAELTPGASVTVTRRDGQTRTERVGAVIWAAEDGSVALATVRPRYRPPQFRGGSRGGTCEACGHTPDDCAEMDCTCRACGGMMR